MNKKINLTINSAITRMFISLIIAFSLCAAQLIFINIIGMEILIIFIKTSYSLNILIIAIIINSIILSNLIFSINISKNIKRNMIIPDTLVKRYHRTLILFIIIILAIYLPWKHYRNHNGIESAASKNFTKRQGHLFNLDLSKTIKLYQLLIQ